MKILFRYVCVIVFFCFFVVSGYTAGDPLTLEERAWLKEHDGQITLAAEAGWPPITFFDENDNFMGIGVEYLRLIEKRLGFRFAIKKVASLQESLDKAKLKQIDVIMNVMSTPDRSQYLNFTRPYLKIPTVFLTRSNLNEPATVADFAGKKVAVPNGFSVIDYLKTNYPKLQLVLVPDSADGLIRLSTGEFDALVAELPAASYITAKEGLTNLRVSVFTGYEYNMGIGSRKDLPILNRILDKGLAMISAEEKDTIYRNWVHLEYQPFYRNKNFIIVIFASLGIIGLLFSAILIWSQTLKRQVRARTRDLQNELNRRQNAEADNLKLEEQLNQAQKMEAIGTLAGGIAHDFNNILSAIFGYAELAQEDKNNPEMLRRDLGEILVGAKRAKELVNQILTFSRRNDQERKPLKIQMVVREVLKLLRASIPTTIEIKQNINSDCETILADPTQIHQVVMNLCTNAYHAMRETGGILGVSLEPCELTPEEADYKLHLPAGFYVRLVISDTGHGMTKEVIGRIFEPYFTTKSKGEGTGLGLSVVHGIVRSIGGDILVYSEPNKGTTFNIYFPITAATSGTMQKELNAILPTGNEKILLVDDDEAIVKVCKTILNGLGYIVTDYTNSLETLNAFQLTPDGFDLLITDMTMPNLTGAALAERILAIRPDMPIILCTGFSDLINEKKAKDIGIRDYLMKPVLKKDLAIAIRKVLDENKQIGEK